MISLNKDSIVFDLRVYGSKKLSIEIIKQDFVVLSHKLQGLSDWCLPFDDIKYEDIPLRGAFTVRVLDASDCYEDLLDEIDIYLEPVDRSYPKADYGHIVGTNYSPAFAVNQIHFWNSYREYRGEIQKELKAASEFGINSLRVYLHNKPFEDDKASFMECLDLFVDDCEKFNILPIFIFFDDCWYGEEEIVSEYEPIKGSHNGRWAKCPLYTQRKLSCYPLFFKYINEIVSKYRNDKRILAWEIWNEPKNFSMPGKIDVEFTDDLMCNAFHWARLINPQQAIISCWSGDRWSDVNDVHNYCGNGAREYGGKVGCHVDIRRGTLVTEAGCRKWGDEDHGSPIDWISWLSARREKGLENPGVYLNWELMAGNSNCTWHWSSKPGDERPPIPWCGFLFPDLTPVSYTELAAIRRYTGKQHDIIFLHSFDNAEEILPFHREGSFSVSSSASGGELVNAESESSKLSFPYLVNGDFVLQAYVRISKNARAGLALSCGEDDYEILIERESLSFKGKSQALSCVVERFDDIYQNIKIKRESSLFKIFLNDMSSPKMVVNSNEKPLKLTLYAHGKVGFDDIGCIKTI